MTLNPMRSPFLFSMLFSWGFLLAVSVFPFWLDSGWKDTGKAWPASLWEAIEFARTRGERKGQPHPHLHEINLDNIRTTAIILVVGVVIGRLGYWLAWVLPRAKEKQGD